MDTLAHFIWTYLIFFKTTFVKLALLFAVLPDFLSWGIYSIYKIAFDGGFGPPVLSLIPWWVWVLYGITHSLFVFTFVSVLLLYITKKTPWYLFAWLIHILVDIPTHTKEFLGTPFLWPFSGWLFDGISWGTPVFMIVNYSLILIVAIFTKIYGKNIFLYLKSRIIKL